MRKLSSRQLVIAAGALAAALAGASVGAQTRPAAPAAERTLGPRMDFDFAAHPAAPAAPLVLAARPPAAHGA